MQRLIEDDLIRWKNQVGRKPLLVRGGRQGSGPETSVIEMTGDIGNS